MRLLLFICSTAAFFNLYQLQALYPWLTARFGVIPTTAGWLNMASLLGMMMTAPFVSQWVWKFGTAYALKAGLCGLILLNLCIGFSDSIQQLFIIRIIQGFIVPAVLTASMVLISQTESEHKRTHVVSCYVAGTVLGSTLSRFYPAIATDVVGWTLGFFTCAFWLTLALMLVIHRLGHISVTSEDNTNPPEYALRSIFPLVIKEKWLLIALLSGFGLLFTQSAIFTALGLRLAATPFNQQPTYIGLIYLACLPALIVIFLSPYLHRKYSQSVLVIGAGILLWVSIVMMGNSIVFVLSGVIIFAICTYFIQTLTTRLVSQVHYIPVTFASGLYLSCYYGGGALGAIFSGYAFYQSGWHGVMKFLAIVHLIIILVLFLFIHLRKEIHPNVHP
ncbi:MULTISPECIES: MFS transporter [Photorhabdus]|nr:MFS transporter [Photorhabdus luminescens]